ncbi:MAG: tyrosine-protein phosphatase [Halioglobus sp.]
MIDIHCHMLPGIDDGARDLDTALTMARLAVEDGITTTICTPHIYPGLFENTVEGIQQAVIDFREALQVAKIPLEVTYGADIQITPELLQGLRAGSLPTLHHSRYFLFEPPHHIAPPGMLDLVNNALLAGYVPVITHPERLSYVEEYYDQFLEAASMGAWLQITGGALLGVFGPRVKAVTERFLADGVVHLLASDGHNLKNRTPDLSEARDAAARCVGEEEAQRLVQERPRAIMDNLDPSLVPPPDVQRPSKSKKGGKGRTSSFLGRLLGGAR